MHYSCFRRLLLLLLVGGFCSLLRAQKFDQALLGASYVPPLQLANWPLQIGPEAQLFVDDFLIHSMVEVVRIPHQPRKFEGNPLLEAEHANGTIVFDPEAKQFRMYYEGGHKVAFSQDGLHWTKPNLGIVSVNGSTENNLVMDYSSPTSIASFLYDPRERDPSRRWKVSVFYYDRGDNVRWSRKGGDYGERGGLYAFFSPDGLHWNFKDGALMISGRRGKLVGATWPLSGVDDVSTVTWDERLGKYIAWLKIWDQTDGRSYRARAMATSDDFLHWSQPWTVLLPDKLDPPDLQLYGNTGWAYESMWLGTLRALHSATSSQQVDLQLITSRDGIHWARANNRGAFIPNGPEGSCDHGYHTEFSNPPFRFGDELFFYYISTAYGKAGAATGLKTGVCLAKLRVDGFASLHMKKYPSGQKINQPAYVITRPLDYTGRELYVNASAGKGPLKIEVLSGDQANDLQPIPGYTAQESMPLEGDGVKQLVTWKGQQDLSSLGGKRIRLKFLLSELSALYSFTIR